VREAAGRLRVRDAARAAAGRLRRAAAGRLRGVAEAAAHRQTSEQKRAVERSGEKRSPHCSQGRDLSSTLGRPWNAPTRQVVEQYSWCGDCAEGRKRLLQPGRVQR
jgi:hypothetical protein